MRSPWIVGFVLMAGCGEPAAPDPSPEPPPPPPAASGLQVVGSAPMDGAAGVARAAPVTVGFSAPLDPGTVNDATVGLWLGPQPIPTRLITDGSFVDIVPRNLLDYNMTYVVTVSRAVQDTAGRPLVREFRLVFATKVNRSR